MTKQIDRVKIIKGRLKQIEEIVDKLTDIATESSELNAEEQELINSISYQVDRYADLVDQVLEDNKVTDFELEKLHSLEKYIIQRASTVAMEDGKVSPEEKKLLTSLLHLMEEVHDL